MDARSEELYYECIDKIDDNIEIAEEYLIGCITWLCRQSNGRADRDRISDDLKLDRGVHKYHTELVIISRLSEPSLSTLIASSLDLTKEVNHLMDIYEKIKTASYDSIQSHHQATKAKKAADILTKIHKLLTVKKKQKLGNLFEGEDG